MEIKVSVIVPFWKVEAFIARCARSLMEQTLQEVEFIFVDDASPDRSAEILREAVAGSGRDVKILSHPENKGLPAARNTGLSAARGKYVFHCDSDDYLEPAMLEKLYLAAEAARADIAYCDFWLDFGDTRRLMPARGFGDAATMLREGFLAGTLKYNVWNKLARRSLYEGISFPEGHSMGEDMTMMMLASRAETVVHVAEPLYHYMKTNDGALTTGFSDKALEDLRFNTDRVLEFLGPLDGDWAEFFKLNVKLPFLFTGEKRDWRNWRSWYPEANRFIGRNKALPFRTRMVQHFAALGLRPLVQAYCFLVSKLLYRR
ncbi:MAG: glycosyltransferase [Bacteroidales bacterium]|nr:glycosyltransferase [Bacteroidales bacterium]